MSRQELIRELAGALTAHGITRHTVVNVLENALEDKVVMMMSRGAIEDFTRRQLTDEEFIILADQMEDELPDEDIVIAMVNEITSNDALEEPDVDEITGTVFDDYSADVERF
jgi:hypothetical protein